MALLLHTTLRSSDPVGDARNAPNHKLIIQSKAVVAVGAHSKLEAKKGYTPQYQVPLNVGLLFHFRYKLRFNVKKREKTFIMSQYFNEVHFNCIVTKATLELHCNLCLYNVEMYYYQ